MSLPQSSLNGWPATWTTDNQISAELGVDKNIHVLFSQPDGYEDIAQVDQTGHQAVAWKPLSQTPYCRPLSPGSAYPCTDGGFVNAARLRFELIQLDDNLPQLEVTNASGARVALSSDRWEGLAMGADGTVVAWRRTIWSGGTSPQISQTTIAFLDSSAKPLRGWPKSLPGAASMPTVGDDGTVYMVTATPRAVAAITKSGALLSGWPYSMPAGMSPRLDGIGKPGDPDYPVSPILGLHGSIYVPVVDAAEKDVLLSLDHSGRIRPGWPVVLADKAYHVMTGVCTDWCGPYYEKPLLGGSPTDPVLYVAQDRKLLALDDTGKSLAGWPKVAQAPDARDPRFGWDRWFLMPDGSLAAMEISPKGDKSLYSLWRWNPDGSLSGS